LGCAFLLVFAGGITYEIVSGGHLEPSPLQRLEKKVKQQHLRVIRPIPVTFVKVKHPPKIVLETNDEVREALMSQAEILFNMIGMTLARKPFRIFEEGLLVTLDPALRQKFEKTVVDVHIQHAFDTMSNLAFDWEGNDFQFDYLDEKLGFSVREFFCYKLIHQRFPNGIPRRFEEWDSAQIQALWLFGAPRILWSLGYQQTVFPADDKVSMKAAYQAIEGFRETPWARGARWRFDDAKGAAREIALLSRIAALPPYNGETFILYGSEHDFKRYESSLFTIKELVAGRKSSEKR